MGLSFADVQDNLGIEDIDYIAKRTLADNDVVFCVTDVSRVEVINSKFDAKEQWQLTIVTTLTTGEQRKYYVSFPYEPKRRDKSIIGVQDALKQLAEKGETAIVHSMRVVAKAQAKFDNDYYKLERAYEDGNNACKCSQFEKQASTSKKASKTTK
jgi:hypothetical protein